MEENDENAKYLIQAIEREKNKHILGLNISKIKSEKNDILQKLQLSGDELKQYHQKLKDYRYISNPDDLHYGSYVRWFPLEGIIDADNHNRDFKLKLTNGGIITSICYNEDHQDDEDICACVRVKNNCNRFFCLRTNECVIFQKLSDEEKLLLNIIKYLDK